MSKKIKSTTQKLNQVLSSKTPILVTLVLIGIGVYGGYFLGKNSYNHDKRYELATRKQLEADKRTITTKFRDANKDECNSSTDSIKPKDRTKTFDKYLKINKYGNRAVIRGCYYNDSLLYKGIDGEWHQTSVNLSLDTRASTYWQKECLLDDVVRTDDKFRPENTSIDVYNYVECQNLRENEAIYQILTRAGEHVTQKDIDVYKADANNLFQ